MSTTCGVNIRRSRNNWLLASNTLNSQDKAFRMYFTVADPISKEQFLGVYKESIALTQLVFAPFGLSNGLEHVVGEKAAFESYKLLFQQWEDLVSKKLFSFRGFDDDRIVASMHKYITKSEDSEVIDEVRRSANALAQLVKMPDAVELLVANPLTYSPQSTALLLKQVVNALLKFYQLQTKKFPAFAEDATIDEEFGVMITKHQFSPMQQFSTSSSSSDINFNQEVLDGLLTCLQLNTADIEDTSDTAEDAMKVNYTLQQFHALLDLYGSSAPVKEAVYELEVMLQREQGMEVDEEALLESIQCNDHVTESLRNGSLLLSRLLNFSIHPLVAYLEQLARKLPKEKKTKKSTAAGDKNKEAEKQEEKEEEGEDVWEDCDEDENAKGDDAEEKSDKEPEKVEEEQEDEIVCAIAPETVEAMSHSFVATMRAYHHLLEAEELIGDGAEAELENAEKLLDLAVNQREEARLPTYVQVQLFIARSKLHQEAGNVTAALDDINAAIDLDGKCGEALSLRAQMLTALTMIATQEAEDGPEGSAAIAPELREEIGRQKKQAAEDALKAFIYGGSSDLQLAALAEETARESCRVKAKDIFRQRHDADGTPRDAVSSSEEVWKAMNRREETPSSHTAGGGGGGAAVPAVAVKPSEVVVMSSGDIDAQLEYELSKQPSCANDTLPRSWMVHSYFTGYEALSTALDLFCDIHTQHASKDIVVVDNRACGQQADAQGDIASIDDICESLVNEPASSTSGEALERPPMHLLDTVPTGGSNSCTVEVKEHAQDPSAYDLLKRLVGILEEGSFGIHNIDKPAVEINATATDAASASPAVARIEIAAYDPNGTELEDQILRLLDAGESVQGTLEGVWLEDIGACTVVEANNNNAEAAAAAAAAAEGDEKQEEKPLVIVARSNPPSTASEEGSLPSIDAAANPLSPRSAAFVEEVQKLTKTTDLVEPQVQPCNYFCNALELLRSPEYASLIGVVFNENGTVQCIDAHDYREELTPELQEALSNYRGKGGKKKGSSGNPFENPFGFSSGGGFHHYEHEGDEGEEEDAGGMFERMAEQMFGGTGGFYANDVFMTAEDMLDGSREYCGMEEEQEEEEEEGDWEDCDGDEEAEEEEEDPSEHDPLDDDDVHGMPHDLSIEGSEMDESTAPTPIATEAAAAAAEPSKPSEPAIEKETAPAEPSALPPAHPHEDSDHKHEQHEGKNGASHQQLHHHEHHEQHHISPQGRFSSKQVFSAQEEELEECLLTRKVSISQLTKEVNDILDGHHAYHHDDPHALTENANLLSLAKKVEQEVHTVTDTDAAHTTMDARIAAITTADVSPAAEPLDVGSISVSLDEVVRKETVEVLPLRREEQEEEEELPCSRRIRARLLNICGSLAYLAGDAIGAVSCFRNSLHYDAALVDSKVKLGSLLIDMDEKEEAEKLLVSAKRMEPSNPVVTLHLGELEINRNDFETAMRELTEGEQAVGSYFDRLSYSLSSTRNTGSSGGAVAECSKEVRDKLENVLKFSRAELNANLTSLIAVSMFRMQPTRPEIPSHIIKETLSQYPHSLILLVCHGEIHSQSGDMVHAIEAFHKASLNYPDNPLPFINAARTYQQLGQIVTAKRHLLHAMKLDSTLSMARVDVAQIYLHSGKPQLALKILQHALSYARHVSEISDVLTAQMVASMQMQIDSN